MGAGFAKPLMGDPLQTGGTEAEAQWSAGGGGECGTQEHWKDAIFSGHQRGFKNANGTGPLKYACHKVELVVAAELALVWKVMRIPSWSLILRRPSLYSRRGCFFPGAWECWTQRSLPSIRATPWSLLSLQVLLNDDSSSQMTHSTARLQRMRVDVPLPSPPPTLALAVESSSRPDLSASECQ